MSYGFGFVLIQLNKNVVPTYDVCKYGNWLNDPFTILREHNSRTHSSAEEETACAVCLCAHRRSATVLLGNSRHLVTSKPGEWKRILCSRLAFGGALCAIPFRQASARTGPKNRTSLRWFLRITYHACMLFLCGRQMTCPTIPSSNELRHWRRTARALSSRRPRWLLLTPLQSTPK